MLYEQIAGTWTLGEERAEFIFLVFRCIGDKTFTFTAFEHSQKYLSFMRHHYLGNKIHFSKRKKNGKIEQFVYCPANWFELAELMNARVIVRFFPSNK